MFYLPTTYAKTRTEAPSRTTMTLCFAFRKYLESKKHAPAVAIELEIERRIEE